MSGHLKTREDRLRQMLGGYFHQDWEINGASDLEVLDTYFDHYSRDGDTEVVEQVVKDLRWLADSNANCGSNELWTVITGYNHGGYTGEHTGQDAHDWLRTLASRLQDHLAAHG